MNRNMSLRLLFITSYYVLWRVQCIERCCQQYICDINSPPNSKWTCQQHIAKWGTNICNEDWMEGYCCKTCTNSCPDSKCKTIADTHYLSVDKATNNFIFDGYFIFLNGANQPWCDCSKTFDVHRTKHTPQFLSFGLQQIAKSGGNVVRTWIFCEAKLNQILDENTGHVTQSDAVNTLIADVTTYLDAAKENNIFVILTLWNGLTTALHSMLTDETDTKLQYFIDTVLVPLVAATKHSAALGAWEIINKPETHLLLQKTDNHCTNTAYLQSDASFWTDSKLFVRQYQRFINIQTAAIKAVHPTALVTVGANNEESCIDAFGYSNLWNDECLIAAGGLKNGVLDFYDIHTYQHNQLYSSYSPFGAALQSVEFYALDKPVVVGEFGIESGGNPLEKAYRKEYAMRKYELIYKRGFNGALMCAMSGRKRCRRSDGSVTCMAGMSALGGMEDVCVVDMDDSDPSFWWTIWKFIGVVIAGFLLFGKAFMVFVGCWCCRICYKYCTKGRNNEDGDGDDLSIMEFEVDVDDESLMRWKFNDRYVKCFVVAICIFMAFVCVLGVLTGLVWIIVIVIREEYGYNLGPVIP